MCFVGLPLELWTDFSDIFRSMPSGVKADRLKFEHSAGIWDNLVSTLILSDDRLSDFRDLLENIDVQNTLIF